MQYYEYFEIPRINLTLPPGFGYCVENQTMIGKKFNLECPLCELFDLLWEPDNFCCPYLNSIPSVSRIDPHVQALIDSQFATFASLPSLSILKNWRKGEFLGGGCFGSVYEAISE